MTKILLVEDDPFLIDIYTTKIKESRYEAVVATDGEEALKKIRDEKPDLVLLDIVLPTMDGWEILRKIKEDETIRNTKVIVLSNLGQKVEIKKGLSLGATKYLIKAHYTPSEVIKEVQKTFEENK